MAQSGHWWQRSKRSILGVKRTSVPRFEMTLLTHSVISARSIAELHNSVGDLLRKSLTLGMNRGSMGSDLLKLVTYLFTRRTIIARILPTQINAAIEGAY